MNRLWATKPRVAVLVAVVAFVATTVRLLVPSPVGLADQGDANRVLCSLDVRVDAPWDEPTTEHVVTRWVPHRWEGPTCGANGTGEPYRSSQVLVFRAAQIIGDATGHPGVDLRVAGVLCAAALSALLGAIAALLPGGRARAAIVTGAIWLLLVDRMIADYYISGYAEPIAVIGILAAVAAGLAVFRGRSPSLLSLVALAAASAVLVTAKSQTATLLPVLAAGLVWRPVALDWRGRSLPRWVRRLPGLALAAAVTVVGVTYLAGQPPRFADVNRHNQVFQTVLVLGDTPEADLRSLGTDASLAPLEGHSILAPVTLTGSPEYARFQDTVTMSSVARFYLTHPFRGLQLANRGLQAAADADQPSYLGTYTKDSGHPADAQESRVAFWSYPFSILEDAAILLAVGWAIVTVGAVIVSRWRHSTAQTSGAIALGLAAATFIQFWTAIGGDGLVEAPKHMALCRVLLVLTVIFLGNGLAGADDPRNAAPDQP